MISKTSVHALLALVELSALPEGAYAGATSVAKAIGAPANYLGKLLQTLAGEGLVVSQKGYGGGFRLARDPHTISLFDAVEPLEHVSRWNGCFLGRGICSSESPCPVHERWHQLREAYLGFLRDTTIADLMVKSGTLQRTG